MLQDRQQDPQPTEHQSPSPKPSKPESPKLSHEEQQPESSKRNKKSRKRKKAKKPDASPEPFDSESSSNLLAYKDIDNYEKHEEVAASYVDLKDEIKGFHDQVYNSQDNTVQEALKEDSELNAKSYTNLVTLSNMLREANISGVMHLLEAVRNTVNDQKAHHDTLAILIQKIITTPITTTTLTTPITTTITLDVSIPEVTQTSKVTHIFEVGGSSFITLKADKGKCIATKSDPSPSKIETDIQEKEQKESQKQANPSTEWKGQSQKSSQCMRTRSQARRLRQQQLHQQQVPPNLVELPIVTMADNRTMAELLQAPTEGYEDAIVVPEIEAANFEIKHGLLTLVQNKQFFGNDKEDPHAHIRYFNKITSTLRYPNVPTTSIKLMLFPFSLEGAARIWLEKEPPRSIQTWDDLVAKFINQFFPPSKTTNLRNEITNFKQRFDESFSEAWDRFKDLLRACPHHGFSELHQLDTFYNALNVNDQDSLNSAAGGNFLDKRPADCSSIIESKSKVRNSRSKAIVAKVSTSASTSGVSPDVAELKDMVRALLLDKQTSPVPIPAPAPVKAPATKRAESAARLRSRPFLKNGKSLIGCRHVLANGNSTPYFEPIVDTTSPTLTPFEGSDFILEEIEAELSDTSYKSGIDDAECDPENDILLLEAILNRSGYQQKDRKPSQNDKTEHGMEKTVQNQGQIYVSSGPPPQEGRQLFIDPLRYRIPIRKFLHVEAMQTLETKAQLLHAPPRGYEDAILFLKLWQNNFELKQVIPCEFPGMDECLALADLGASINLMPFSVWEKLSLPDLTPTCMTLELADRSISKPMGIAKDISVKVSVFHFPADFVVVDFEPDPRVPLILGRCFLKTSRALIDVHKGELTLRIGSEAITYNLDQTSRYSANYTHMTANKIDVIDMACEEYSQEVLGFTDIIASGNSTPYYDPIVATSSPTLTPFGDSDFLLLEEADSFLGLADDPDCPAYNPFYYDPEGDILILEAILNSEPPLPPPSQGTYLPEVRTELKVCETNTANSSVDEPTEVELKELPPHLEYAFLEGDNKLPVIIAKELDVEEKSALVNGYPYHPIYSDA
ncbi:reverse transcriptase domain-containing protein [Tanacetum coccineum]